MKRSVMIVSVAALAACSEAPAQQSPSPEVVDIVAEQVDTPVTATPTIDSIVPMFERSQPSSGTIGLSQEGDTFILNIVAGGIPNGAATAADCAVQVRGKQGNDDVVRAEVVPSVTSRGEVTAADIGDAPLKVDVMIGPEGAMVTDHGAANTLCGMGSDLNGFYKRLDTPD